MANGGFLISPRVRVFWGDINLTAYDGPSKGAPEVFEADAEKGGPIVYDVRAELSSEGEGPTAEMKWDPTGKGLAAYEWFVSQKKYLQGRISIEFFYPGGKQITMYYKWSGQSINYGNDMTVTVKFQSELAGLINGNQRSASNVYDEDKGAAVTAAYNSLVKQYGLSGNKDILSFNEGAKEQAKKVKIASQYGINQTFGAAVANLAKQSGHVAFPNAVNGSGVIIFPPFFDPKGKSDQKVLNNFLKTDPINPAVRYGYLLGPGNIDNISRQYNWKPPTQSNSTSPATQLRARDSQGRFISNATAQQQAQDNRQGAAAATSAPLGPSLAATNPGIRNVDNPDGPGRQLALNEEKSAELSFETFLCPVFVGIKPYDILYVPSFLGEFIEDWIVQSVSYAQSNGKISISVRATRVFGIDTAMNKTAAEEFKAFAKSKKLIGPGANLDAWDAYNWGLPGS